MALNLSTNRALKFKQTRALKFKQTPPHFFHKRKTLLFGVMYTNKSDILEFQGVLHDYRAA